MDLIFVDTGAFIALADRGDDLNARAEKVCRALASVGDAFVTTNHVVDETCSWLLRHTRHGHKAALAFGQTIISANSVVALADIRLSICARKLAVVYSTSSIELAAWEIFARYDTAGFSFTDCVSFAVMQSLGIKKAFSFDAHYDIMGFERL
jgi:predicted nucleic acid-binding protein